MNKLRLALMPMLLTRDQTQMRDAFQRHMLPLGPFYLANYLESLQLPLEIFIHDDVEVVKFYNPDIVGFSCVTENFGHAMKVAADLKKNTSALTVLGGPHITCLPEYLPDDFDFAVVGEGECALRDIVLTYLKHGKNLEEFHHIPGLVYHKNGGLMQNGRAESIKDLDSLPLLHRKKWAPHIGVPHLMTTRGCVYNCFFCAEPTLFKGFRQNSPQKIVDEIELLIHEFPRTTHIRFYDDIFPVNKNRLREIAQLICERKINQKVSFSCFIHAKLVDDEVADLLKQMNFIFVQFGAETGSSRLLTQIKPEAQLDLNQRAIDLFYRRGIHVGLTMILGTPSENEEDLKETLRFMQRNKSKIIDAEINPAVCLPGTQLFEYARQKGVIPNFDKMDWDFFQDKGHLKLFDPQKYIYLGENVDFATFFSHLKKLWLFNEEVRTIHNTDYFMKNNYMAGFMPVSFETRWH